MQGHTRGNSTASHNIASKILSAGQNLPRTAIAYSVAYSPTSVCLSSTLAHVARTCLAYAVGMRRSHGKRCTDLSFFARPRLAYSERSGRPDSAMYQQSTHLQVRSVWPELVYLLLDCVSRQLDRPARALAGWNLLQVTCKQRVLGTHTNRAWIQNAFAVELFLGNRCCTGNLLETSSRLGSPMRRICVA